jgi:hypothetical protein
MKLIFPFLLLLFSCAFPAETKPQETRARVAVVSLIDSTATHVYGNRWYSTSYKIDIYNYGRETIEGLANILEPANMEVIGFETPEWINKMSLLNLLGKPSKPMEKWFDILMKENDVDILVMVVKKFEPENKISHRYLNSRQYGIGTYTTYPDAISLFSFIGYYIFDTKSGTEIKINKNHDKYLLTDIRLDNRMTYHELKDLPEKYLDLTRDKMRQVVRTRNVEIKRALLEYLNQSGMN